MSTRPGRRAARRATPPTLLALALLGAAGAARADDPGPWSLGLVQGFTHDSNVYRVVDGPAGNYSSTGLVGRFDQPVSRQRFHGSADVRYNRYFGGGDDDARGSQSRLNNTSYSVDAGWDWQTIDKLSGTIGAAASQGLANYATFTNAPTSEGNRVHTDQVNASVRWGGDGMFSLYANGGHSNVRYSDPTQSPDSSGTTAAAGVGWRASQQLQLGLGVRFTHNDSPYLFRAPGATTVSTVANTAKGRNVDLNVDWVYSPQTAAHGRLSWTHLSNSAGDGMDFSGLTGALGATWAPSAKVVLTLGYGRDAGSNGSYFNTISITPGSNGGAGVITTTRGLYQNSQITDSLSAGVAYAATAKIAARLSYNYQRGRIASTTTTGYDDRYTTTSQALTLGADWTINRAWALGCNVAHQRQGNGGNGSGAYDDNVFGCTLTLTVR